MPQRRQIAGLFDVIRPTMFAEIPGLSKRLGAKVILASETFQHTGSFKFRGAYNVAANVRQNLLITASSGNFGQALAYACSLLHKSCIVVMPSTSAKVKVDAVREFGGTVEFIDGEPQNWDKRVKELAEEHPEAYIANGSDDLLVIDGNSSLGRELRALPTLDIVVAPVGGGGLISGIVRGLQGPGISTRVLGAEPLMGNDAAESLRRGEIVRNEHEPQTIADGARTPNLGKYNWEIICRSVPAIVEVPEDKIIEGVRLLFELANLKVEPAAALGVAAVMTQPDLFRDQSVCCIVSGGNVDPAVYAKILSG